MSKTKNYAENFVEDKILYGSYKVKGDKGE